MIWNNVNCFLHYLFFLPLRGNNILLAFMVYDMRGRLTQFKSYVLVAGFTICPCVVPSEILARVRQITNCA